jgi:TRAP-type C4-dicarboxylate transport system permease small subunit
MGNVFAFVESMSKLMQVVAGTALTFIMLLTGTDVALRIFGHPIIGTYEMVGLGGALVLGFALPMTSWLRGHIFVDFLYLKCPKKVQQAMNIATRIICIAVYLLIGWNLLLMGMELHASGELTITRHLPFYPVAYALGLCCFAECLVLICDIGKITGGTYE